MAEKSSWERGRPAWRPARIRKHSGGTPALPGKTIRCGLATLLLGLGILSSPSAPAAEPASSQGLTFHAAPKPLPAGAVTEDWPHFLGPRHNATTKETHLL